MEPYNFDESFFNDLEFEHVGVTPPSNIPNKKFYRFKKVDGLHFLHLNARSLFPKLGEVKDIAIRSNAAVIGVTETWLSENTKVDIEGYKIYRRDRKDDIKKKVAHGGVCAFIRNDLKVEVIFRDMNFEIIWIKIRSPSILTAICYRTGKDTSFYQLLGHSLRYIKKKLEIVDLNIILLGDFNTNLLSNLNASLKNEMYEMRDKFRLEQLIRKPTRIPKQSILDLIFVSDQIEVINSGVTEFGISDHLVTYCTLSKPKSSYQHTPNGTTPSTPKGRPRQNRMDKSNKIKQALFPKEKKRGHFQSKSDTDKDDDIYEGSCTPVNQSERSLTDILGKLTMRVRDERKNIINVCRDVVLKGGLPGFEKQTFDPHYPLDVRFKGEDAIDKGGPQREFMRLAIREIKELPIFFGPDNKKILILDYTSYNNKLYYLIGKMIAFFIVHRGPLPTFFSPTMYNMLAYGIDNAEPELDDIVDEKLQKQVKMIADASDREAFRLTVDGVEDLIRIAGCLNQTISYTKEKQAVLVKSLLDFCVCERVRGPLQQFMAGLNTLGIASEIQDHPGIWRRCFVPDENLRPLDANMVANCFSVDRALKGSDRRKEEERIVSYWNDLLKELERNRNATLEDLLVFATGMNEIPMLGFDPQPKITFQHDEDLLPEESYLAELPTANTCDMVLRLPVVVNYDVFKDRMVATLTE